MAGRVLRFLRRNRHTQNALHSVTPTTLWIVLAVVRLLHHLGGTDRSKSVRHVLKPGETLVIHQEPRVGGASKEPTAIHEGKRRRGVRLPKRANNNVPFRVIRVPKS